ncbi:MAG: response regulator transcription factor [Bacteroidota bacterium]|jgi:two-component system alkaline phosphatase synthesis response regulator PhoP
MTLAGKSILIVDPDRETSSMLLSVLSQEGYYVTSVSSGQEALNHLQHFPDLIILNPQLPDMNGLNFLRAVKQNPELPDVPVFILSNKETETDEIISLEVGADDYITKPVQALRLIARMHALFRRQEQQSSPMTVENDIITIDDLSILIPQYIAVCGQESIAFSKKEFELLVHLAKNRGRVLTRQGMFRAIWGNDDSATNRTIDVHIGRIRKKLKNCAHYIETVPSVGYRFKENQAV